MVVLTDEPVPKSGQVPKRENRSRINIIADILDICERDGPIKKTRLMQSVNLSSSMITEYLEYMVEKYLILKKEGGYYAITQRGARALHWYRRIIELLIERRDGLIGAR